MQVLVHDDVISMYSYGMKVGRSGWVAYTTQIGNTFPFPCRLWEHAADDISVGQVNSKKEYITDY